MKRRAWVDGGQTTPFGNERIWYRVDGAGPTLLFSHGYPTSSHDYAWVVEILATKYRCVTFDLLGFGATSKPSRDYSYPLQHEVLEAVTRAAGVTRAVLVVHDYSVTLGQDFLAKSPQAPFDLAGVVFLNGALDPAQHRALPIQRLLASSLGRLLGPHVLRRSMVMNAFRKLVLRKAHLDEDEVWESITNGGGLAVMPRLLHYIAERRPRRDALVSALASTVPKAFVWGVDDPVSGRHVLDAVRSRIGDAPVRELPGVGHYPQLEAPDAVASFIDDVAMKWAA